MKTILITGGSQGIGLAFAKEFAKGHNHLILVARNTMQLLKAKEDLEASRECVVDILSKDLTIHQHVLDVYEYCKPFGVDVLINNAGFGASGRFDLTKRETIEKMCLLNVNALVTLCHLFLQDFVQQKSGEIINIASIAGFQAGPYFTTYFASKAFVLSFTKGLIEEYKPLGIKITCVCPGTTATAFFEKAKEKMPVLAMSAEQCVSYVLKHQHKSVVVPGWYNRLALLVPQSIREYFIKAYKRRQLK